MLRLAPLAFAATVLAAPALAQTGALPVEPKAGTITTSATATVAAEPDIAMLDLAVRRAAKTAREALDANNRAMSAVLAAMKERGVADRDLQTSGFSISPQYEYDTSKDRRHPPRIVGYEVTNALTVRVRDLARLGGILDLSVTLGVNEGGSIRFGLDDPAPVLEEARRKAARMARDKARTLSDTLGVGLGRIQQIAESGARPPSPRPLGAMVAARAMAEAVPVAAGETGYSVTVTVRWELQQQMR